MPRPRLSVVMIVKNEATRLPKALASFAALGDLVDDVCIYDTGSTDDSVKIARACGARVDEGYWDDDFARARNAAAAMAQSEWLFVVDADEQVRCDATRLEQLLASTGDHIDSFLVSAEVDTEQIEGGERWMSPRIYRPTRARYHRPVHTGLIGVDGSSLRMESISADVLLLHNSGFDTERAARSMALKDRLTTSLIDAQPEGSADKMALVDRGRARAGQGRHEEALVDLRAAFSLPGDGGIYDIWAGELLAGELLVHQLPDEAECIVDALDEMQPGRAFTRWLRARVLAAQAHYSEAFGALENVTHAVDGGFSPLLPATLYRAGLEIAIEMESFPRIIACLVALVGVRDQGPAYEPLLAKWWKDLPTSHLARALAASSDRPIAQIADEMILQGGAAEQLGRRLMQYLQSEPPTRHRYLDRGISLGAVAAGAGN